jgi:hypothetical protein
LAVVLANRSYICYTQKNGFSENKFILPNGSECVLRNYAQDITVVEGGDCDIMWCDELVPLQSDRPALSRSRSETLTGNLATRLILTVI